MIILSMNIRGVGGAPKLRALRRIFEIVRPDVILIQETMVPADKAIAVLSKVVGSWHMSAVDAAGRSGGLLTAWNPFRGIFDIYKSVAGILLLGRFMHEAREIKILNCYGPYLDRIPFWNRIQSGGLLRERDLIIGGDLNFTLSAREA